jgi:hypothetical protein
VPLVLQDLQEQLDHLENPEHKDLQVPEDLQETLTSMTSFQWGHLVLMEHLVHLVLMELLVLPDLQAHQDQVMLPHMPMKDLESVEMVHLYTDHVDLQDHQDSQDPRVTWDFQELWVQMERWVHRVCKVFQDKMDHQDLAAKPVLVA